MKYYSTKGKSPLVDVREAVMAGLAPDGGLYMPVEIPKFSPDFLRSYQFMPFADLAYHTAKHFFSDAISPEKLWSIVGNSFDFEIPLIEVSENRMAFELFHGPTLAFKDFAARFMARLMGHFVSETGEKLTILVATSGDTGGAVGHGFLSVPGIDVVILYPSGMVSKIQEQQLTTMGQNIKTLEVNGTFDDCQRMVKRAFVDKDLQAHRRLGSANSINIARLIPQTFYYVYLASILRKYNRPNIISVPSGNLGNLTAGLIAHKMGAHLDQFVAATNINDSVVRFLSSGKYEPHSSFATISNAMDVGDPSNFVRMDALFHHDPSEFRALISGFSYTDIQTRHAMREVYNQFGYIMDPHGAVGWLGLNEAMQNQTDSMGVFIETAHPAKFVDVVNDTLGIEIDIPGRLAKHLELEKEATKIKNAYSALKDILMVNCQW
jgi:threonine synthase